jgi:hypothetical protein
MTTGFPPIVPQIGLEGRMKNWAAIEISLNPLGRVPVPLLRCAYRASRTGLIALILNGVDVRAADRVLDPVVARLPRTIPGVAYLAIDDDDRVRDAVLSAQVVLAATAPFLNSILRLGVEPARIGKPRTLLTRLGQEALFLAAGPSMAVAPPLSPADFPPAPDARIREVAGA